MNNLPFIDAHSDLDLALSYFAIVGLHKMSV